jgi:Domain of unknown function (DUF4279)
MAHLQRAVATLRIMGDDLIPDEVSALLGVQPTMSQTKGQEIPTSSPPGFRLARTGIWRLAGTETEPENLDGQVRELLDRLNTDISVWHSLAKRFKIDLFCGWFMGGSNEGVVISPATLLALGERGIELGLDIYGPETDA